METKSKSKARELGLVALVLIISFLIVLAVSFTFRAVLSFLEQDSLAKEPLPKSGIACLNSN